MFRKILHLGVGLDDFRVAFRLCFKASPSTKPFMWKSILFTCKRTKLCVWIKLIFEMQLGNHLFYTCLKQFHCEEMSHEFLNKYSHRSLKQERCSCCLNLFNSGYHYHSRRPDLPQFIMKVYKEHTRGNCRGANAEYVTCNTQVSFLFFIFLFFIFLFFIFYFFTVTSGC